MHFKRLIKLIVKYLTIQSHRAVDLNRIKQHKEATRIVDQQN